MTSITTSKATTRIRIKDTLTNLLCVEGPCSIPAQRTSYAACFPLSLLLLPWWFPFQNTNSANYILRSHFCKIAPPFPVYIYQTTRRHVPLSPPREPQSQAALCFARQLKWEGSIPGNGKILFSSTASRLWAAWAPSPGGKANWALSWQSSLG